ncbi:MAG: putative Ig domain-containing protein [PVC group bacterium]
MISKIIRLMLLIAGCALLAAGIRLLHLKYCSETPGRDKPVAVKVTRSSADRGNAADTFLAGLKENVTASPDGGGAGDAALPSPTPPVPIITTGNLPMGAVSAPYRQIIEAAGFTGTVIWKLAGGELPPGLMLTGDGVLLGFPEQEGEWRFTVTALGEKGEGARKEFRLLVRPDGGAEGTGVLKITTGAIPDGFLGRNYLQQIESEGGEPPYEWTLAGGLLPELVLLNKQSGVLYGTPREIGKFQFTLRLTDGTGTFVESSYTLEIKEAPVEIVTDALPPAVRGEEYSLAFRAVGGVPPYRWEVVTGRLPQGLQFDPERGILSGVPESREVSTFLIRVTGREGRSAEKEFVLEVTSDHRGGGGYSDPRIMTDSLGSAVRGILYNAQLTATGGDLPYIWTISQGNLPPSLTLDGNSGMISGIPEEAGKAIFTVLVSDSNRRTGWKEFSLVIDYQLVYITTGSLGVAVAGEPYSQSIEATGGTPPYAFSLESGSLPDDLTLKSDGQITGTVSDIYFGQGTQEFIFRIRVTDQAGLYDIAELRLTVRETAEPTPLSSPTPAATASPVPTITPVGFHISTDSLPGGWVGKDYTAMMEAAHGAAPYTWSFRNLPQGLSGSSSGTISGVPEIAADYEVDISAEDAAGTLDSKTLSLSIKIAGVSGLIAAAGDGKAGLAWVNPGPSLFKEIRVIRKTTGYPQNAADGENVYRGIGDNIVDTGLTNGVTYFYAVIAYDQAGTDGGVGGNNRIEITPLAVGIFSENDPYADEVISFSPLSPGGFGSSSMPDIVLGSPRGEGKDQGSLDVVSLHARVYDGTTPCGGTVILRFTGNLVFDGEGSDFTIFENVFDINGDESKRWMEPAIISVSQDGKTYYTFPYDYRPSYYEDGSINYYNPYSYQEGFAGINPVFSNNGSPDPTNPSVSGGDSFDLDDLTGKDVNWIQYIRITATGDGWLNDGDGDPVRHIQDLGACSGAGSSGFDLDAVCAVNY